MSVLRTHASRFLGLLTTALLMSAPGLLSGAETSAPLPPGNLTRLVHLGLPSEHITGLPVPGATIDVDDLLFAGYGPDHAVQGHPGVAFDLGAKSSTGRPLTWTVVTDGDGVWADNQTVAFRDYWTITLEVPSDRTTRLAWRAADDLRVWLDAQKPVLAGSHGEGLTEGFPLTAGIHRLVIKYRNTGVGAGFSLALRDADGGDQTDLRTFFSDVVAPTLLSTTASGEAFAFSEGIVLTFSEPMGYYGADAATLSGGDAGGQWEWMDHYRLHWAPDYRYEYGLPYPKYWLEPGTTFTVTLNPALCDLAVNALQGPRSFSFTTADPRLTSCSPTYARKDATVTVQLAGSFTTTVVSHPSDAVPFAGHHYRLSTDQADWWDALMQCEADGGHLATISSAAENDFVWQLGGRSDAWLGMSRALVSTDGGAPEWMIIGVDGKAVTYENWAVGQPAEGPFGGSTYACFGGGAEWYMDSGFNVLRPYVCEFDTPSPPVVRLTRSNQPDRVATVLSHSTNGIEARFDLSGAASGYWTVVVDDPAGFITYLPDGFYIGDGIDDLPSFTPGPPVEVDSGTWPVSIAGWATGISPGPPDEADQPVWFTVWAEAPELFQVQPAVSPTGTLTFTPARGAVGSTALHVAINDQGGSSNEEWLFYGITILPSPTRVQMVTMGDWQVLNSPLVGGSVPATAAWTLEYGPGYATATFGEPASAANPAVFDRDGTYYLRLSGSRGRLKVVVSLPGTVVVDDSAGSSGAASFTTTGRHWKTGTPGFAGTKSLVSDFGPASAVWSAQLAAGWYQVSWWKTVGGAAARPLTGRLAHADGTAAIVLDGDASPAGWRDLGIFRCSGGAPLRLTMARTGGSVARADAVRFIRVPGEIIDFGTPGYSEAGTWSTSTLGRIGVGRSTTRLSYTPGASATWTTGFSGEAHALLYRVPSMTNDPLWSALFAGAIYDIDPLGGTTGWADLGRHTFAGGPTTVTLGHDGGGTLRADALRVAPDTVVVHGDLGYHDGVWLPETDEWTTVDFPGSSSGTVRASDDPGAYAVWRASLAPGRYRVWWWRMADYDATYAATVWVGHDAGYTRVDEDLTTGSSGWTSLGEFNFTSGIGEASVQNFSSGTLRVDAVRFEPLGDTTPVQLRPGGSG